MHPPGIVKRRAHVGKEVSCGWRPCFASPCQRGAFCGNGTLSWGNGCRAVSANTTETKHTSEFEDRLDIMTRVLFQPVESVTRNGSLYNGCIVSLLASDCRWLQLFHNPDFYFCETFVEIRYS